MKTGQTFDLVEIIGNSVGYVCDLEIGQQCLVESAPQDTFSHILFAKFNYGHHPRPLVLYQQDLKKIGKLTVTKIK